MALVAAFVPAAYVTGVMANYVSALLLDFPVGAETLLVGFSNPRFPAQLQVLTIPLLPLAIQKAPTNFWRSCLVVVAAVWWMCFIGAGSRTGWLAIGMTSFVLPFLVREGRRWLWWQLALAATGATLWVALFHVIPPLLGVASEPEGDRFSNFASVGARWELWQLSVKYALANPLLGIGPMHFAYLENGLAAHPHNFWLQIAAEWGIPAALLIAYAALAMIVALWRGVRREKDPSSRWVGMTLFGAVMAWGIGTLADGYMIIPTSQVLSTAVLMLAIMWLRLSTPEPAASAAGRRGGSALAVFSAIALAVLATLPLSDFGRPTPREQAWRAKHPEQLMWPRFWQQGWIGPDLDPSARGSGEVILPRR